MLRRIHGVVPLAASLGLLLVPSAPPLRAQEEEPGTARRRLEYFYQQRSYPFARIPAHPQRSLMAATLRAQSPFGPNAVISWTSLGPAPIGGSRNDAGRVTALAVDPANTSTIYLGGAQGGVWKTTNTGTSWTPLTDTQCSLAVGSIALDPLNSNIVYVGSGEENFSGDSYYGCGILKSSDGGTTWSTLGGSIFDTQTGGATIGRIHIPAGQGSSASGLIYAATSFGLYKSTDAGNSWTLALSGTATDVITDPTTATLVYAAFYGDGIYKSTNSGGTFTQLTGGLPASNLVGRIALAIIPSAPQTIFAAIATPAGNLLGLFKSTDAGVTWTELSATGINCSSQCWYAMVLAVDPANVNTIYVGALSLYKSTDGGNKFSDVGGSAIHVDHHAFAFDPTNSSIIYSGNDGGVYRSGNAGSAWSSLNTNLTITQFYPGTSVAPTGANPILGGTQDNGTLKYSGTLTWTSVLGGDGGFTATNPLTPTRTFAELQWIANSGYSGPRRSDGGGYFLVVAGINLADNALFIPPLVLDQTRPSTLYFGTQSLYRTKISGDQWTRFSALAVSSAISAIGISASDSNTHYVGSSQGELFVTTNGGTSYAPRRSGLPSRYITSFAVHRSNPLIAYVTYSGFNAAPPAGHVFKTVNGGSSWTNVSGDLPNVPVNAIVLLPDGELEIGTDLGVYQTSNDGTNWSVLTGGLPNVAVLDLLYHAGTSTLIAATHGRGMWSATVTVVAAATSLAVDAQPGGARNGAIFGTQPVVSVRTAGGDLATSSSNSVTATLNTNSGSGTLSGTTTVSAVNGVTTFTDLKITGTGTFTLTFTATGLTPVTSSQFNVTSAATQLVIITQPSATATVGVAFSQQPAIQLRDGGGNNISESGVTITAAIATGGGTLGGTTTATTTSSGLATFTNLSITGLLGNYTLGFSATGLTTATSNTVNVNTVGAAAQLTIATQPSATATVGLAFGQQPAIQVSDGGGNNVGKSGVTITAAIATGGGTLGGTTTATTTSSGLATFTNLSITGLLGNRTLSFSATGLTTATSNTVNVNTAGVEAQLTIAAQPSATATVGTAFAQQPAIQVSDGGGNNVGKSGVTITAAIATGGGTLGGTSTATTGTDGLATFTNLSITGLLGNRTLSFSATGLTAATSNTVNVNTAGTEAQLAITTQPSATDTSGVPFSRQPAIQLQDASGNSVGKANVAITVDIASGSGTVGGTNVATTTSDGLATFTDLRITGSGSHTLRFRSGSLTAVTANSMTVVMLYTLSVSGSGAGSGTVSSQAGLSPAISCAITSGVPSSTGCSARYVSSTPVTVTVSAASGSTFAAWTGACSGTDTTCSVVMNADASVGTTFVSDASITLSVLARSLPGSGTLLAPELQRHLDAHGNRNGRYDIGDVLAWLDRGGTVNRAELMRSVPRRSRS